MAAKGIEASFPLLNNGNYRVTSPADFNYNCLAFVMGDLNNWWDPEQQCGFYWPPGFPADVTIETVIRIIRLHGYVVAHRKDMVPSTESIAIFAKDQEWLHFAKYVGGGWFSKIGEDHDISHDSLELMEGDLYGEVVQILSRPVK